MACFVIFRWGSLEVIFVSLLKFECVIPYVGLRTASSLFVFIAFCHRETHLDLKVCYTICLCKHVWLAREIHS